VIALVPTSEIQRYATDLRSLTGGRGRFAARHDHHEVVPAPIAERLVKQAAAT
jgi:elongation factor G